MNNTADTARQITACRGNAAKLGEKLGISRAAASKRIKKAGLEEFAAILRARNHQKGRRLQLKKGSEDPKKERGDIVRALREHGTQDKAAAALGIGRRSLQRALVRLGIK